MANPEHLEILKQGVAVWNQWREENSAIRPYLINADLSSVNLSSVNLSFAHVSSVNLSGANLSGASLSGADLSGADLSGANLTDANLREADLTYADLTYADLTDANLTDACLYYAILNEAILTDLNKAVLGRTIFAEVDLSQVKNLDEVIHHGPSRISYEALFNPKNKSVPEIFWRDCGVDEETIQHMKDRSWQPIQFYSCFISYSHSDKSFARRLHDALQGRGIRCWLDEHQLLPGDVIHDVIDQGIRQRDKVLLCCSKASLNSWWVHDEIEKTLEKERRLSQARGHKIHSLIPINLDNYYLEWQDGKASQVRSRLAADFTGWKRSQKKFDAQFEQVIKALRTGEREPPLKSLL